WRGNGREQPRSRRDQNSLSTWLFYDNSIPEPPVSNATGPAISCVRGAVWYCFGVNKRQLEPAAWPLTFSLGVMSPCRPCPRCRSHKMAYGKSRRINLCSGKSTPLRSDAGAENQPVVWFAASVEISIIRSTYVISVESKGEAVCH